MRRFGFGLAVWAGLAWPAAAATPTTPEGWRTAAAQDLAAIHDLLRDNAPAMVVTRDSAPFRRWLDAGLQQARRDLPKVNDGRGYYFVVKGYVGGFRDSHIVFETKRGSGVSVTPLAWPGFTLAARGAGFVVDSRSPDAAEAPPVGAQLVGCDGRDVGALIAAHDRYDGDFQLAAERVSRGRYLLLDRGNPFAPRARACSFRSDGVRRTYRLIWRPLDKDAAARLDVGGTLAGGRKLDVAAWGARRWWLTVPSMDADQPWTRFFADVTAHLDAIRGADAVVIDLRGNDGGSGAFGDRLVRLLWGDPLASLRRPRLGPTVYRVSKLNRDYWASVADQVSKSAEFPEAIKAEVRTILTRYDAALARGEPTFEMPDDAPVAQAAAAPNPMRARVVLLTDSACTSACLDLMDQATAMPNVVQAGATTWADTIFMEMTIVPALPSGLGAFGFGQKAWPQRPRGSNVAYVPAPRLTWSGRMDDDAALKAWLAGVL